MNMESVDIASEEPSIPRADEVTIGKDILELLSSSMYVDPLTIYREYVQNSADAIEAAVESQILTDVSQGRIDIKLDHIGRRITIRDNGKGIPNREFAKRMLSFGASQKRGTNARGFRGVGRLSGLGYCQELVFRSRSIDDRYVSEIRWDCRKLSSLLGNNLFESDLSRITREVTQLKQIKIGDWPTHFFEVEISKPRRLGNDLLVNEREVHSYLAQSGPCPYEPHFTWSTEIQSFLRSCGADAKSFEIFLNESAEPIYKPYANVVKYSDTELSRTGSLKTFKIERDHSNPAVVGWLLHHDYLGAIPTALGVKGLRARVGNIQIGGDKIFAQIFPEERFSSWTIGEVHVVDQAIVPNGRRDDFERNSHYDNLLIQLVPLGSEVAKQCRSSSERRNREKSFGLAEQKILDRIAIILQASLARSQTTVLRREIGHLFAEMQKISGFDLFSEATKLGFAERLKKIERKIEKISNSETSRIKDPLRSLPAGKQSAYREVISLIYECSSNSVVAKSLVDKMLARISKSK